jgi:glycosyltransferase involved in cell wall biosynthesis
MQATTLRALPGQIAIGRGNALFIDGICSAGSRPPRRLWLSVDGAAQDLMGAGFAPPRSTRGDDYWWGIADLPPAGEPRTAELRLHAELAGGDVETAPLGEVELVPEQPRPPEAAVAERLGAALAGGGEPLVAICMATFEPDPELLRRQLDSIRGQSHERWICLISDDGSSPAGRDALRTAIGGDERFVVSLSEVNRGFYANFERALSMVPREAELVALSDQDDRWYPDKIGSLIAGLEPSAQLVYSDMRIVTDGGREISPTYWAFRRNNHTDFGSLVLANTVTGAASLFRRELLDDALPFPPRYGNAYHDHWLAQVAHATGGISYVDRPLYDYVQHGEAALGYMTANANGRFSGNFAQRARISLGRLHDRGYHLGWRLPYFNVYCRIALAATVLEMRCGPRMRPADRDVLSTLRDPWQGALWVTRRSARDKLRTTETLGRERVILAGLAWYGIGRARGRVRDGLRRPLR